MFRTFALMCALVFLLAGLASAQYSPPLKGDIPFAFYAGNEKLPPGEFRVEQGLAYAPSVLIVRLIEDPGMASFLLGYGAAAAKAPETGQLVFTRYADGNYFLTEVWRPGSTAGIHLIKSKRERESVTSRMVAGTKPERIVILATVIK